MIEINYHQELNKSFREAKKLGMTPQAPTNNHCETNELEEAILNLHEYLIYHFGTGYWGNQCLNLSAQSHAWLNQHGFNSEIVYGDVLINKKTLEYGARLTKLKKEYKKGYSDRGISIHAWVALSDDLVLDFTLPQRIHKNHPHLGMNPEGIVFAKITDLTECGFEYWPMLVGSQFLERTCGVNFAEAMSYK